MMSVTNQYQHHSNASAAANEDQFKDFLHFLLCCFIYITCFDVTLSE